MKDTSDINQKVGKWLNRNVAAMGLTSLFSGMSHEMATSILAQFTTIELQGLAALLSFIEGLPHFSRLARVGDFVSSAIEGTFWTLLSSSFAFAYGAVIGFAAVAVLFAISTASSYRRIEKDWFSEVKSYHSIDSEDV